MKVKTEISICTGLMLNDHSNPYIESTTILSDNYISGIDLVYILHIKSGLCMSQASACKMM